MSSARNIYWPGSGEALHARRVEWDARGAGACEKSPPDSRAEAPGEMGYEGPGPAVFYAGLDSRLDIILI
jgi:hypothetical protein